MKFVPYDQFYIISPLSPEEVKRRINDSLILKEGPFLPLPPLLRWKLKINEFEIVPQIKGRRNSFTSKVKGVITTEATGSRIKIKMTMVTLVLLLLLSFFAFITISSINWLMKPLPGGQLAIARYVPFAAELWLYSIATIAFKKDGRYSMERLLEILEGHIEIK